MVKEPLSSVSSTLEITIQINIKCIFNENKQIIDKICLKLIKVRIFIII